MEAVDPKNLAEVSAFIDHLRKMGVRHYSDGKIVVEFAASGLSLVPGSKRPRRAVGPFSGEGDGE